MPRQILLLCQKLANRYAYVKNYMRRGLVLKMGSPGDTSYVQGHCKPWLCEPKSASASLMGLVNKGMVTNPEPVNKVIL